MNDGAKRFPDPPADAPWDAAVPGSVWLHIKTGGRYTVVGLSTSATNGCEGGLDVVYRSHASGRLFHRLWCEFLDGRFVREL